MDASPPPPPEQPKDAARKAPLPRVGTFRTARPASAGPRRGATVLARPQSFSAAASPASSLDGHTPPRLRRGASFASSHARRLHPPPDDASPAAPAPLRRPASRRASAHAPDLHAGSPAALRALAPRPQSRRLPRAGTFAAFRSSDALLEGAAIAATKEHTQVSSEDVKSTSDSDGSGRKERAQRVCGMCSACAAMPPWAPERMATLSQAEKNAVLREMQHKEERGKLEAELRKKRLSDMQAVARRLAKRPGVNEELQSESASEGVLSAGRAVSGDYDELESVDLGTELASQRSASKRRSRTESTSTGPRDDRFGEDISGAVQTGVKGRGRRVRVDDDCGQCGELECKVKDLEEQLGVLREVVRMCGPGEERDEEEKEKGKKPKTWKDKVISAYFGGSAVGNERSRLRAEVEALRKATDFLFHKLQPQQTNK